MWLALAVLFCGAARGAAPSYSAAGIVSTASYAPAPFASNTPLGFIGFLGMMGCAFVIVSNVRKMGKAGLESITASMKGKRLKSLFGDAGKNLRKPFRKDDSS